MSKKRCQYCREKIDKKAIVCPHCMREQGNIENKSSLKMICLIFLWIIIFPLPATILIMRNQKLDSKKKLVIILACWIGYFAFITYSNKDNNKNSQSQNDTSIVTSVENEVTTQKVETTTKITTSESAIEIHTVETTESESDEQTTEIKEPHLYDKARVRNLMNGYRTEKLGEYAVISADSSECTEEAIADVYFNYYKKNNYEWIIIPYTDRNDNSCIWISSSVIEMNTSFEKDEYGDYSHITSYKETFYIPNDDGITINIAPWN